MIRLLFLIASFAITLTNGYVPKIAVVANFEPDNIETPEKVSVSNSYVRWIEDVGGQLIPILPWYTQAEISNILDKTNGVLWLGGKRDLNLSSSFELLNKFILDKVIEKNNKGVYFPLLGICQGLELLHSIVANSTSVLSNYDSYDYMLPIEINKEKAKNQSFFKFFSDEDIQYLTQQNSTVHLHHLGTDPKKYDEFPSLGYFLEILAIGSDRTGKSFISIAKAKNYPIYGVQFHPEKIKYDRAIPTWAGMLGKGHIRVNDNIGLFFIDECRKNNQSMTVIEEKEYKVINTMEVMPVMTEENVFLYLYSRGEMTRK